MRIGVLGLGLMGGAIALRLRQQGFEVSGWNRSPGRAEGLRSQGLSIHGSVGATLTSADTLILALSDTAAIEAVLLAPDLSAKLAGRTFIQMGTIAPAESREVARRVAALGGDYLEAPVLGSIPEARTGSLILMVGGDEALFKRCLLLLRCLGKQPRRIGPVGQGAAMKLAMNQLIGSLTSGFALSLGLVRSEGIDVGQFMELLRTSALYAPTFDKKLSKYLSRDYAAANFPLKHLRKDIALFRRVAQAHRMDPALLDAMLDLCRKAEVQGHADDDYSALYEAIDPPAGE